MGRIVNSIKVPAEMSYLADVLSMIRDVLSEGNSGEKSALSVEIVVEEIFTNICDYAYNSGNGQAFVTCELYKDEGLLRIIFEDQGKKYNPLESEDPNFDIPLEDRPIGGLGIFMTKQMMDKVEYDYRDNKNILTIEKSIFE